MAKGGARASWLLAIYCSLETTIRELHTHLNIVYVRGRKESFWQNNNIDDHHTILYGSTKNGEWSAHVHRYCIYFFSLAHCTSAGHVNKSEAGWWVVRAIETLKYVAAVMLHGTHIECVCVCVCNVVRLPLWQVGQLVRKLRPLWLSQIEKVVLNLTASNPVLWSDCLNVSACTVSFNKTNQQVQNRTLNTIDIFIIWILSQNYYNSFLKNTNNVPFSEMPVIQYYVIDWLCDVIVYCPIDRPPTLS